tara:strand:+ start:15 stop:440 length:426 start_codon:yes stop_codon:yes gene_type:complete
MIVTCENCSKTFNIQEKLIPSEGRYLQCGSCSHKWFFKISSVENKIQKELVVDSENNEKNFIKKNDPIEKTIINNKKNNKLKKPKIVKNFLVFIISIIAIIILVDTFKNQLNIYIPGINSILNNLYETLKDLSLFFNDLIN